MSNALANGRFAAFAFFYCPAWFALLFTSPNHSFYIVDMKNVLWIYDHRASINVTKGTKVIQSIYCHCNGKGDNINSLPSIDQFINGKIDQFCVFVNQPIAFCFSDRLANQEGACQYTGSLSIFYANIFINFW